MTMSFFTSMFASTQFEKKKISELNRTIDERLSFKRKLSVVTVGQVE